MFKWFCCILCCLVQPVFSQEMLTVEQQLEDLEQCREEILRRDPNFFLFQSEEDFNQRYDSIRQSIHAANKPVDFYKKLALLIAPSGERHLSLLGFGKPSSIGKQVKKQELPLFPLLPYFSSDSLCYLIRDGHFIDSLSLPIRLDSLDGRSMADIYTDISQYIPEDDGVTTWKPFEINHNFSGLYYSFVTDTMQHRVVLQNGQILEVENKMMKTIRDSIRKQSLAIYDIDQFKPALRYAFFNNGDVAYLKVPNFRKNRQRIDGHKLQLKKTIRQFFKAVNDQQSEAVIIDLRNNPGGDVDYMTYLLAFVQDNQKRKTIFTSSRKPRFWFGTVCRKGKTRRRKKTNYEGALYVLTNGGTYSAAVMFTSFSKQLAQAKIAGVTAGGRVSGTTAGRFKIKTLKHSKIKVRIPEANYVYKMPDKTFNLRPDFPIERQVEDFFDYKKDHQLDSLIKHIKANDVN